MSQDRWIITKGGGQSTKKGGRMRLAGTGERLRKERRQQLGRDLEKARQERLAEVVAGGLGVRAEDGSPVERLSKKVSSSIQSSAAIITDPPLRRASKQLGGDEQPGDRVAYAKEVVSGPVVVNGKQRDRKDAPAGNFPGSDLRRLFP